MEQTKELQLIEQILVAEIDKMKREIPYQNKDNDFIAKRYVALREAERILNRVWRRIKSKPLDEKKNETFV